MRRLNVAKVVPTIFLGIGVLMLLIAALLAGMSMRWAGATTTTGTVVEHIYHAPDSTDDDDGPTWSFIVEWVDEQGNTRQTDSGYSTNRPPEIGSHVPVQYFPDDPERSRVSTWAGRWLASTIVGGVGGVFTLIGGILLAVFRREPFLLPGPMQFNDPTRPTDGYHGPVDPPRDPSSTGWEQPER